MNDRMKEAPVMDAAARFIAAAPGRAYPARVIDLARMCLADWAGVVLGAQDEPAGLAVRRVVESWRVSGNAHMLGGGTAPAVMAALVNGTFAHCLDFDDVHFPSLAHFSAPTWAAVLALGEEVHATEPQLLSAFITGFEIGAKLGAGGMGEAANSRGWHSTGVVGRLAAAAASAVLLGLDAQRARHCLALAATQTSGLVASFGTDGKPFHAGRAGSDGIFSAQLAAAGMRGASGVLDGSNGLARAIAQDGGAHFSLNGLGETWELERNALKPYASCGFTHAPIDAARKLSAMLRAADIARARIHVHPLAPKVAGQLPHSPLAAKFSIAYCVSLGLHGGRAQANDFTPERLAEPSLLSVSDKVEIVTSDALSFAAARLEIKTTSGSDFTANIASSLGNPENPMSWDDLREKFLVLATPVTGSASSELFDALRSFDQPGQFARVRGLLWQPRVAPPPKNA